jgi:CD109 antigen
MRLLCSQVSLSVRDPGGFTVATTSGAADAFGVLAWTMPTSVEPVLGVYTVAATSTASGAGAAGAASAEQTFTLAKYVLPTFNVVVTPSLPFLLQGSARSVDGTLSVTHTNGAPVAGSVVLSLLQPSYSYSYPSSGGFAGGIGKPMMGMVADAAMPNARPAAPMDMLLPSSSDSFGGGGGVMASLLATLALTTRADGSASFSIALPNSMSAASVSWDGQPLVVRAAVTESATGETQNGTASVPVSSKPFTAVLTAPANFKPGLPWRVSLALTRPDGTPAAGADASGAALAATASRRDGGSAMATTTPVALDADGAGFASFTLPREDARCCNRSSTSIGWAAQTCCVDYISVSLAGVTGVTAYAGASVASATDGNGEYLSLGPLTPDGPLSIGGALSFTPAATAAGAAVRWALLGPGGTVAAGAVATPGAAVSVTVPLSAGATPTLLAWYQSGAALVFDWAQLAVDATLPATLSAGFGAAFAAPGDAVNISASGSPSCRVFFTATDASVALMGADSMLTPAEVLAAAAGATQAALDAATAAVTAAGLSSGNCYTLPAHQAAGAELLTSLTLPACVNGWAGGGDMVMMEMMPAAMAAMPMADGAAAGSANKGAAPVAMADTASSGAGASTAPRVRLSFPETWVWGSADADASGAASLATTAPDTLTSWRLCAFSLHPTLGLAIAPTPPTLAVSMPFYVRAALPYSIVRGEKALLRVGLFSNFSVPCTATVSLVNASGSGFELDAGAPESVTVTLQPGGSAGVSFAVTPSALGALSLSLTAQARDDAGAVLGADALRAPLTVVAEGIAAEVTQNVLLRVGGDAAAADAATILTAAPPASAVRGSARATLSVVGDIMGQTLAGLGALLTIPSGCGEQNMIGLAPNVAVLEYLAATPGAAPAPALAASALSNAAIGYQRELTYRHADGSFSAFGESDAEGSTWLTAFVLKVFSAASGAGVAVDASVLSAAATFLTSHQAASGAFQSVGNVIHTDMVSGATGEVSLTAYILAALLAAPPSAGVSSSAIASAAAFLALRPAAAGDAYAATLRAHALAAACATRTLRCADAATAAAAADALATTTAGVLRHWEAPRVTPAANVYWQAPPADIELTGYAVLTLLALGRTSDATDPARWLVSQRSGGGGFSSTQDTVVGLDALAAFAAATYSTPPALTLAVSGDGIAAATSVAITAPTASLLQQLDVPAGSTVAVTASGSGTALVQLTTRYNVLPASAASGSGGSGVAAFSVTVSAVNVTGGAPGRRRLLVGASDASDAPAAVVHQQVCATRAAGASDARQTGMVLLEVGLFSGYTPVAASLAAVQASSPDVIKRVEVDAPGRRVVFYLDSLRSGAPLCVSFDTVQEAEVFGLAAATSRVSSYYAPADEGAASIVAAQVTPSASRPASGVTGLNGAPLGTPAPPASGARRTGAPWALAAAVVSALAALLACAVTDTFPKVHLR